MKLLKLTLLAVVLSVTLFSCKKDSTTYPPATGKFLTDVGGECLPINVHGEYFLKGAFTRDNYVEATVNLISTGTYDIKTDTINHIYFTGSGRLGETGENLVRLYPHYVDVMPDSSAFTAGVTTFYVQFNTDSLGGSGNACSFDINILDPLENPAVFTLGYVPGNCTGALTDGVFSVGKELTNKNTVTLDVNVITLGGYSITSRNVNGVEFKALGIFTVTGPQKVTLIGSGTPEATGTFNFPVTGETSSCSFSVAFGQGNGSGGGTGGNTASYTLGGAPGNCTGATTSGTIITGTALTAANTLSVQVNVTALGTYSISTNSVNGISFSKTGTFTTVGSQTIDLVGSGTPVTAGANNYTLTGGSSSCTVSVTATQGTTPPPTGDCKACAYVPWCEGITYTQKTTYLGSATETTSTLSIVKDTTIDGKVFKKTIAQAGADPVYYNCTDGVTTVISFNPVSVQGSQVLNQAVQTLLKANEAVGTTWANTLQIATPDPSVVQKAYYDWSLAEKISSRTVLGVTYNDVIRVHLVLSSEVPGSMPKTKSSESDYYYAKGIGLIETVAVNSLTGNTDFHQELRSYLIP